MAHLYMHIPFCAHRCGYCDFLTSTDMGLKTAYVHTLAAELPIVKSQWDKKLKTIYMGGGTPSMLSLSEFDYLLNALHKHFDINVEEFTVECNPESVSKEKLALLKQGGVNRISLGMQSAHPKVLGVLERQSTPYHVQHAVDAVRTAGIDNYSLDLIYGVPHQTREDVLASAQTMINLGASHISAYGLKLEYGVPMQQKVDRGQLVLPEDDVYSDMLDDLIDYVEQRGFKRYEVSNFALAGHRSKHNLAYWYGSDTLGAGLGSVYKLGKKRYTNVRDMQQYMDMVNSGQTPIDAALTEHLSDEDIKNEYLMTRFRLSEGIDIDAFNQKFNADFERDYSDWIKRFTAVGVLVKRDNRYSFTNLGLNTANYSLSRLI